MNAQHTPGPWEACSNLVRTCRNSDGSGGFLVAECPANIGKSIEDARLIAAAPEILDALERCLSYLADLNGSNWIEGTDSGSLDMKQMAKALQNIAFKATRKARGAA